MLQNNGGDDEAIASGAPSFAFDTRLEDGDAYAATIISQPESPAQLCTLSNASGTVSGTDVSDIAVSCTDALPYTVTVDVSGYNGSGLVLQNNGGDDLAIPAATDGSYDFAAAVYDGREYAVTVVSQPSFPNQTCTVTNGSGAINGSSVNVALTCVDNPTYVLGGTITNLAGSGLRLDNDGGDAFNVVGTGTVNFQFPTELYDQIAFDVGIAQSPSNPSQTCTVTNGSGSIDGADYLDVAIVCAVNSFTVGGTVTGLAGTGLVLQNNAGDNLIITGNGSFTFGTALADLSAYSVTVLAQPSGPNQTCSVTNGSGNLAGGNVTNVAISCVTNTYTVGGSVSGLASGNSVTLQNNGGDDEVVSGNTSFTFDTAISDGSAYAVTVDAQPTTPNQTCTVTNGSGNLSGGAVSNVQVGCVTNQYTVSVSVAGLIGEGLVLRNNGGDDLSVLGSGNATFATAIDDETSYNVTILAQPTDPNQVCSITGGSGTVNGGNVTSGIDVTCVTEQYTVGGTVTGYDTTSNGATPLVLQNNGGDDLTISANGSFVFATAIDDGMAFAITVSQAPEGPSQTCTVSAGSATLSGANYSGATVSCNVDTFTVGGTVSGLAAGQSLVLQNNAGDDLTVSANGGFSFDTALDDLSAYTVTVLTNPTAPNKTCTVSNGAGNLAGANVTNVSISCVTNQYVISGDINGLGAGDVVLQNNGGDDLTVSDDGAFMFATALDDLSDYEVTVLTQPTSPNQTCTVSNGSGTLSGGNVTNVTVNCVTETYTIGGTLSGYDTDATDLVLQNNGGDSLTLTANGAFTFDTALADLSAYNVTVQTQPTGPSQTCTVSSGSGNLAGANVTNVTVSCVTGYSIGGTVSGLAAGNTITLQNNGGDDEVISGNGAYNFDTPVLDGGAYDVQVSSVQPTTPNQVCSVSNGSGNVASAHVTNADVSCVTTQYDIDITVSGLAGTNLTLQNNGGGDQVVNADGTVTYTMDDGSAYAITISAQPGGTTQQCVVVGGSGSLNGGDVSVTVNCPTVSALYPTNGADWNDYVLNNGTNIDGDTDPLQASDAACTGGSLYNACLHGGEMRLVTLNGETDCAGFEASDNLGAFNWVCDDSTGTARIISTALNEDAKLIDLIDSASEVWRGNYVTVTLNSATYAVTDTSTWWSNTIVDGSTLDTAGNIYVLTSDPATPLSISANRVGLAMENGVSLSTSSTFSPLSADGYDYLWIEGYFEPSGGPGAGISLANADFLTVRRVKVQSLFSDVSPTPVNINLSAVTNSRFSDLVSVGASNHGMFVTSSSDGNLIQRYAASNNRGAGLYLNDADRNRVLDALLSSNFYGIDINGGVDNVIMGLTGTINAGTAVLMENGPDNNVIYNFLVAVNNSGLFIFQNAGGNVFGDFVSSDNRRVALRSQTSDANYYTGTIKIGNDLGTENTTCADTTGTGNGGIGGGCTTTVDSDADFTMDVFTSNTFKAKVTSDDSVNPDDDNGAIFDDVDNDGFADITNWVDFETRYRAWGVDGSAFPNDFDANDDNTGPLPGCTKPNDGLDYPDCDNVSVRTAIVDGRIWDWRLATGDAGDAGGAVALDQLTLPTGNDRITHTWSNTDTVTFLRRAIELIGDGVGNDDGLCETREVCLYTPNIGAYQGSGSLTDETFVDGVLTGITLRSYSSNGVAP